MMCEFISGKINPETLAITTAKSLRNHSEIPGNDLEWEWINELSLHVRSTDAIVGAKMENYIRQVYGTWQNCADTLIVEWLKQGKLPGNFYKHSKLDDQKLILFAHDCAERVLPIWTKQYPDDNRPANAIKVARKFADGKATKEEAYAAADAAYAAYTAAADAAYAAHAAAYTAGASYAASYAAHAASHAAYAAADAAHAAADAADAAHAAYAAADAAHTTHAAHAAYAAAYAAHAAAHAAHAAAETREQAKMLLEYINAK